MQPPNYFRKMIIIFYIASRSSLHLSAQSEAYVPGSAPVIPVPGYVILCNGDTLYGKVRWALKYVENNPVEIKFFADNGATKSFKAGEIKGFGNQFSIMMEENEAPFTFQMEHYLSLPSFKKGVIVFMNRLIEGKITVFQNRSSAVYSTSAIVEETRFDGIEFSFIPGEGLSIGPSYRTEYIIIKGRTRFSSYLITKENAEFFKVDKDNYEDSFDSLFGDCISIKEEINKNPDLRLFRNFMILAEIYNQLCRSEAVYYNYLN